MKTIQDFMESRRDFFRGSIIFIYVNHVHGHEWKGSHNYNPILKGDDLMDHHGPWLLTTYPVSAWDDPPSMQIERHRMKQPFLPRPKG